MTLCLGLIDTGAHAEQLPALASYRQVQLTDEGVAVMPGAADLRGHGSQMIARLQQIAPQLPCHVVQVFDHHGATSPLQVATAIDLLVADGVRVINLSLGLRQDRPLLRQACADAVAAGVVLCAAMPMQGGPVYPAAYPDVISVTGDARCALTEWTWFRGQPADFGAAPARAGASLACATFSALLAAQWAAHPHWSPAQLRAHFEQQAQRSGPQQRERLA